METTTATAERAQSTTTDGGLRGTLKKIIDGCTDDQLESLIEQSRRFYGDRSELGERADAEPDDLSA